MSSEKSISPLALYPIDDLIDEIMLRAETAVFYGIYPLDGNPEKRDEIWNCSGDPINCSGLAVMLAHKIAKDILEDDEG